MSETYQSREFTISLTSPSRTLRYYIDDTYSEDEAYEQAIAQSPAVYGGLYRQSVHGTAENNQWTIEVTYGPAQSMSQTEAGWYHDWHLTVGSEQVHQTHSIKTVKAYVESGSPTDTSNAINIADDMRVEGIDADVSTFDWSETLYVPKAQFNAAYVNNLYVRRGCVASHAFRGPGNLVLEPRETLLRSATAEPNGDLISVHFDFSASPNVKDLQIGKIKNIEKGGWEYLWVWWANDLPANELTKKAKQVNIEQVKRYGSFWGFGLPRRFT